MNMYIDEYRSYLTDKKAVSKNTLESYLRDIRQYQEFLESCMIRRPEDADEPTVNGFVDHLKEIGKSSSTVTRMLASIRSYYQFLMFSQIVSRNPAKMVKVERVEKKAPEILTDKEIRLLLSMPNSSDFKGARDKAMLELLYATGIRVSELINLDVQDVRCEKGERGEVICRNSRSTRSIPMYPSATDALNYYVYTIRPLLLTPESGDALFINLNGARLSRQGFWKIVKSYSEMAKIRKEITPHTLRHSFAIHLFQNGASLHDLQIMLGHADISSTQMYANMSKKSSYNDVYDRCHPFAYRAK